MAMCKDCKNAADTGNQGLHEFCPNFRTNGSTHCFCQHRPPVANKIRPGNLLVITATVDGKYTFQHEGFKNDAD